MPIGIVNTEKWDSVVDDYKRVGFSFYCREYVRSNDLKRIGSLLFADFAYRLRKSMKYSYKEKEIGFQYKWTQWATPKGNKIITTTETYQSFINLGIGKEG